MKERESITSAAELLRRVPFLATLPPADLEALARRARRHRFRRGETIFHKDDPGQSMFVIEEGAVRIYLPSPQGADLTLAVLGPGDFFGDLALLDGKPRSASATALQATQALALERGDFIAVIQSQWEAAMAVLAAVVQRLRETDEMAADLAFLDVRGRLARKLLELASAHGVERPGGILLNLTLTQEELANMIGVTRESVNRQLALFRRLGVIDSEGRRFLLRDPNALRRYVGSPG